MSEVLDHIADPIQRAIDGLLEMGRKRGFVTWEEMNAILPGRKIYWYIPNPSEPS